MGSIIRTTISVPAGIAAPRVQPALGRRRCRDTRVGERLAIAREERSGWNGLKIRA